MKMEKTGPSLNNNSISEFEKQLNIRLPQDYKDFMLAHNGGTPKEDWAFDFVDVITNKGDSSVISSFFVIYGEETKARYDDLRKSYRIIHEMEKAAPPLTLPIADDPGGNLIGMSVAEKDFGQCIFL